MSKKSHKRRPRSISDGLDLTQQGNKLWRNAIMKAVHKRLTGDSPQYIEKLADRLVRTAMTGDVSAIKEIGDRLDGKPRQETELSGPNGSQLAMKVEVVFVKPPNSKS